jgi:CheY-like chemotaxis protein
MGVLITVLYVENEENDVIFMRRAFKLAGLDNCLRVVESGREAMDYLTGQAPYADRELNPLPFLLLVDLNLPAMSGFELLSWLRQQPQLRELPVVIFSSSARTDDLNRAYELGANDYVQKPSSGAQFLEMVKRLKLKWLASANNSASG